MLGNLPMLLALNVQIHLLASAAVPICGAGLKAQVDLELSI